MKAKIQSLQDELQQTMQLKMEQWQQSMMEQWEQKFRGLLGNASSSQPIPEQPTPEQPPAPVEDDNNGSESTDED